MTVAILYHSHQPDGRPVKYEAEIMRRLDAAVRVHQPDAQIVGVVREVRPTMPQSWQYVALKHQGDRHLDHWRRILAGLALVKCQTVYLVDHDSLYVPENFADSELPPDQFQFNPDYVSLTRRGWFIRKNEPGCFNCRGPRDLFNEHFGKAAALVADGNVCAWDEPGFCRINDRRGKPVFFRQVCAGIGYWRTALLNVDLRDGCNMTGDYLAPSYQEAVEPWGNWRELWRALQFPENADR